MTTAKLFINGQSQAVRIPKAFQFEGVKEVNICKNGNAVIITPKKKSWTSFADTEPADDDFMQNRSDLLETDRVHFE